MIKINRSNLSFLVDNHYKKLKDKIESNFPITCKYTLEQVLRARPKKLHEIALWFRDLSEKEKEKYSYIRDTGYAKFSKKNQEYNAYNLAKALNIKACVYCNRNYTFTVIQDDKEMLRPDIDHYYDKRTYPILALSFYNLIPSCVECNRTLKRSVHFDIKKYLHPYDDDFNTRAKFQYKLKPKNKIEIKLKVLDDNDDRTKNIIKVFKLNEIYNEGYTDIVSELILKRQIYNDSYIDELFTRYEGTLFKNREDLLRLITCGYMSDEDISKRPLSKLIKDISEELELL